MIHRLTLGAIACIACLSSTGTAQSLIVDGSFESGSVGGCDIQGRLPPTWFKDPNLSPDTYTYVDCAILDGLTYPDQYGNFWGLPAARDGSRFVAGWSYTNEAFGTTLTNTLYANARYRLSAYFVKSETHTNANPAFEAWLTNVTAWDGSGTLLATLGRNPVEKEWTFDCVEFVAPSTSDRNLICRPVATDSSSNDDYIGTDGWKLIEVELEPLVLDATPPAVAANQHLKFTSCGGGAGRPLMLTLTGLNGAPRFVPVLFDVFDGNGIWRLSGAVPPGLSGISTSFTVFGILPTGKLAATNTVDVLFD